MAGVALSRFVRKCLRPLPRVLAVVVFLRNEWRILKERSLFPSVTEGIDIAPSDDAGAAPTPLAAVPFPAVDLSRVDNPVRAIIESPDFEPTDRFFSQSRAIARSLVSARSQALIYALIRNLKPAHVVEVGTYEAGTSEAICRALHANGQGTLHAVEPITTHRVIGVLAQWPDELRAHVRLYAMNSAAFYERIGKSPGVRPMLVFVDGNHEYNYAVFDIWSAAGVLAPGGFIVVDNVVQAGPYLAARDFLSAHPWWTECAVSEYLYDQSMPFDRRRCGIRGTDLMILRAPKTLMVTQRPVSFPETLLLSARQMQGIEILPAAELGRGVLHAQCILRGFTSGQKPVEAVGDASQELSTEQAGQRVTIPLAVDLDVGAFEHVRVEIGLSWTGERPLPLLSRPTAF